jgi:hypothetical protein
LSENELTFDSSLVGPDDEISLAINHSHLTPTGEVTGQDNRAVSVVLGQLFIEMYDELLREPVEWGLQSTIAKAAVIASGATINRNDSVEVTMNDVVSLRHQFEGLGLIRATSAEVSNSRYICWQVTDKARRFAIAKKAQRKQTV